MCWKLGPRRTLGRGPFRGSQAVAAGLITRGRLAGPNWLRMLPDVYIEADAPLDHLTWCHAALLTAPPGTVLGYHSALGLYCRTLMPDPSAPVDLVVPDTKNLRKHPRRRAHWATLEDGDTWWFTGLPVTTPARTGFDLARGRDLVESVVCLDALLNRQIVTMEEIAAYLPHTLTGSGRAARALSLASPLAESPMETRTRLTLVFAGLPTPQLQYQVRDAQGFVARLDLAYPVRRVGIEYDGDHHRTPEVFRRDAVRANRLRLAGWTVLRFTSDDLLRHPDRMVDQVRALLAG